LIKDYYKNRTYKEKEGGNITDKSEETKKNKKISGLFIGMDSTWL